MKNSLAVAVAVLLGTASLATAAPLLVVQDAQGNVLATHATHMQAYILDSYPPGSTLATADRAAVTFSEVGIAVDASALTPIGN